MGPRGQKGARTSAVKSLDEVIAEIGADGWLEHSEPFSLTPADLPAATEALEIAVQILQNLTPAKWDSQGIHLYNKLCRVLLALRKELEIVKVQVPSRVLQVKPPADFNRKAKHPAMPRLQVCAAAASISFRSLLRLNVDPARQETVNMLKTYGVKRSRSAIRDWERAHGSTDECRQLQALAESAAIAPKALRYLEAGMTIDEADRKARADLTSTDVRGAVSLILSPAAKLAEGE